MICIRDMLFVKDSNYETSKVPVAASGLLLNQAINSERSAQLVILQEFFLLLGGKRGGMSNTNRRSQTLCRTDARLLILVINF